MKDKSLVKHVSKWVKPIYVSLMWKLVHIYLGMVVGMYFLRLGCAFDKSETLFLVFLRIFDSLTLIHEDKIDTYTDYSRWLYHMFAREKLLIML